MQFSWQQIEPVVVFYSLYCRTGNSKCMKRTSFPFFRRLCAVYSWEMSRLFLPNGLQSVGTSLTDPREIFEHSSKRGLGSVEYLSPALSIGQDFSYNLFQQFLYTLFFSKSANKRNEKWAGPFYPGEETNERGSYECIKASEGWVSRGWDQILLSGAQTGQGAVGIYTEIWDVASEYELPTPSRFFIQIYTACVAQAT